MLADLIFWVNRAMQTWLSVTSHYHEQSLISPPKSSSRGVARLQSSSLVVQRAVAASTPFWLIHSQHGWVRELWAKQKGTKWDNCLQRPWLRVSISTDYSLLHYYYSLTELNLNMPVSELCKPSMGREGLVILMRYGPSATEGVWIGLVRAGLRASSH